MSDATPKAPPPKYTVVHRDDALVVVHKDAGLLTVAAAGVECLVDLLEAELDRERFGRYRLAAIHRLDRETSGLLVFARERAVATALARQFAAHRVERVYVAIVAGRVAAERDTVRGMLHGKRAVTHYEVTARRSDSTTVALRLETGRRNQIRMHLADLGHPVLGDRRFGPKQALHPAWPHQRLALHAGVLGFWHPVARRQLRFTAPLPRAMELADSASPAAAVNP